MSKAEEAVKQAMGWNDKQLEIYKKMGAIVVAMNAMDIDDLAQTVREMDKDEAIGPLIDPTAWRDHKFEEVGLVKKVVNAIITFKREVSGIGRFDKVGT